MLKEPIFLKIFFFYDLSMVWGIARQIIELRQLGGCDGGRNGSEAKPCATQQSRELDTFQSIAVTRGKSLLLSPLTSTYFVSTVQ